MDNLPNQTIRLTEGETEMLLRALVEANEQCPAPKTGETQILHRQPQTAPSFENTNSSEETNFIL